ncbi:hypothetical protein [Paraburkholderia sp. ZP32-5]|uniref:hypothetical protein n=1 Tax=Paraburkholderia sp. ZP32-5 TaxID=2883245 RepID=UPI001F484696|nr:hypothetical protein [Paraburkholderia sp. ZP32-5]
MKMRILSLACVATAAALLTACTAATRNSGACEQLMRSKLAETSSDTLRVSHRGAAIHGSRVVVEGTIEHLVTASEVAASAAQAASAAVAASGAVASAAMVASAPRAVSDVKVASKPAAPKKLSTPAAAECTFHGETLDVFRWLAPEKLATPVAQAASSAG